jgi:hypothetical protein
MTSAGRATIPSTLRMPSRLDHARRLNPARQLTIRCLEGVATGRAKKGGTVAATYDEENSAMDRSRRKNHQKLARRQPAVRGASPFCCSHIIVTARVRVEFIAAGRAQRIPKALRLAMEVMNLSSFTPWPSSDPMKVTREAAVATSSNQCSLTGRNCRGHPGDPNGGGKGIAALQNSACFAIDPVVFAAITQTCPRSIRH